MATGLPEHVERFITDHIDSVELIDVLLLLKRTPSRAWTPEEVSERLYTTPASAANRLQALRASAIVTADETQAKTAYRYQPSLPGLIRAVEGLEEAYGARRTTVINLIFSKPSDKIRTFADAFRIREDK